MPKRGLAFGGWGKGLALGKQRRRTLREVRLLTREQMTHPMGCVCEDHQCDLCTPEPEEYLIRLRLVPSGLKCEGEGCGDADAIAAYMDDDDGKIFGLCADHNHFSNPNLTIIDEFEAQRRK